MKKITVTTILLLLTATSFAKRNDSLDLKIGQMILIGINDRTSLAGDDPIIEELRSGKLGGVVLFEKNLAKTNSSDSLKLLITNLQRESRIPLFVAIDEEGGRVHRLKEKYGFVGMPSATYLGKLDIEDSILYYNRRLGAELAALGINLDFAPVLDMAVNPENTVIVKNERSFGAQPQTVVKDATLCIRALHENHIKTILKHFPGHGSSTADSHVGIVDVSNTWSLEELLPYDKLVRSTDCDAVMTAHIINQRWDPTLLPATLSEPAITGLLRNLLGFKGVVFSDDMQMKAIADNYGFENAIMLSINAGVDVLMFANTNVPKDKIVTASQIHTIIRKLVRKKKISRERINESYERIMALKNK